MSSSLIPRNTLVTIVEIKEAEKKTAAGIVLPTHVGSEYKLAEVVSVGAGCKSEASKAEGLDDLTPGQTVLIKLASRRGQGGLQKLGLEYKDDQGRDLILVEQTNIVAIVDRESDLTLTV